MADERLFCLDKMNLFAVDDDDGGADWGCDGVDDVIDVPIVLAVDNDNDPCLSCPLTVASILVFVLNDLSSFDSWLN